MADVQEHLLGGDKETSQEVQPCNTRYALGRRHVGYSLAAVGLCLFVAGNYSQSGISPQQLHEEDIDSSGWGDAKCYKYTGHRCGMFKQCAADVKAGCSVGGSCFCQTGCVGSDGRCDDSIKDYKVVASKVKLRNLHYKDQYLYAPRYWLFQQLRTADKHVHHWYAYNWNIYQLPGDMWVPQGTYDSSHNPGYFLSPVEFPGYVAAVAPTKWKASIPFTGHALNSKTHSIQNGAVVPLGSEFVVDLYALSKSRFVTKPFNPQLLVNSLCRPGGHPDAVQIIGAFGKISWYEHFASWMVFGWVSSLWGDPRKHAYWVPEPPLNISLPACPREQ